MTRYLSVPDVIAIHSDLIARYGGSDGLRDINALEAALHRPHTGYYDDVIAEAAALWESLSQNHPFVDGNKRVGFAVTYTFLIINGYVVSADGLAAYRFIESSYSKQTFVRSALENWLRDNVVAVSDSM